MPTNAPPSFYDNIAAMGAGGAGAPPGAPKPPGAGGGEADAELIQAFGGIFRVMKKMIKIKPELREEFAPINQMLKAAVTKVLKVDPKQIEGAEESEKPEETVTGNKSPQEPGPAPTESKSPQDVPVPA